MDRDLDRRAQDGRPRRTLYRVVPNSDQDPVRRGPCARAAWTPAYAGPRSDGAANDGGVVVEEWGRRARDTFYVASYRVVIWACLHGPRTVHVTVTASGETSSVAP